MSDAVPPADAQHALPVGLRLAEFEIRSVLGVGGFGIVYHAFDHALERDVAIKEYMPIAMAARRDALQVSVLSQGHAETFGLGLRSFVNEARLLARFDHPSLVKVHRFWEANGTAYMVMPLYRGRTLKALRQSSPEAPDEAWLRRLLEPLLGALETLHAEGVFHRDIAPDNILVGDDDRPVLLDFGAARRVIGGRSQALTAILKPSYAPIEQYGEATGLRQGAWTDLYALGATLCFAITGQAPQAATARALGTDQHLLSATPRRGLSDEFLRIVDWMMAPRPEHRPQSVGALREVLGGKKTAPLAPVTAAPSSSTAWERTVVQPPAAATVVAAPAPAAVAPEAARPASHGTPRRRKTVETPSASPAPRTGRQPRRWRVAAGVAAVLGATAATWLLGASNGAGLPTAAIARSSEAPLVDTSASPTAIEPAAAPVAPAPAESGDRSATVAGASTLVAQSGAVDASTPSSASAEPATSAVPAEAARPSSRAARPHPRPSNAVVAEAEPVATAEPAPSAAPVSSVAEESTPLPTVAPTSTSSEGSAPLPGAQRPREQCKGRLMLALYRCVKRVCSAPEWTDHPDCQRVRRHEANNDKFADH